MTDTTQTQPKLIRCGIYTRKSTSEGLDQDFTSLDAQREAAESYIASQKHEGWLALPARYDDGGYTGANMDRPALQKLMTDIKDGKVDCVVVYKVDRLSRSLIDFARLLELFEHYQVTFVSVTQHFNTHTSMGRLTLNILLSFAQFEREMISERTRDKMSAARKKGKWVGGRVVLGYDLDRDQRRLVVNPKEAELVQQIFLLYLEHRSALRVAEILKEQGHRMKAYFSRSGKPLGGVEFHKGHIHNLLNNVVYIGKVSYHDQLYQGLHEPIITEEVFQRVQALFAENRKRPLATKQVTQAGLLSQLLYCKPCHSVMINTYSYDSKDKKKRYKYYVCTSAQKRGYKTCPTRSINADAIDRSVVDCLRQLAQNTELQQQQIEALKSQIQEELACLKEEQQRATDTIQQLTSQITVVREQQRMGVIGGPKLEPLTEQLQDAERRSTELRVKQMELEEQLFNQTEFKDALLVTSPIWDTLFIQEKRRILRFLLKEVEYDGRDGKLGITFSPKGIRLLSAKVSTNNTEVTDGRVSR